MAPQSSAGLQEVIGSSFLQDVTTAMPWKRRSGKRVVLVAKVLILHEDVCVFVVSSLPFTCTTFLT